jgi:hypothetical protein
MGKQSDEEEERKWKGGVKSEARSGEKRESQEDKDRATETRHREEVTRRRSRQEVERHRDWKTSSIQRAGFLLFLPDTSNRVWTGLCLTANSH